MKNQKKIPISAERAARLAQLRKRFLRGGLLSVAGILVFVFMLLVDLPVNAFNGIVPVLIVLACVCFSGYALCGGDRGTRFESAVIVMLILVISVFFVYVWHVHALFR